MSFKITCNECGREQEFRHNDKQSKDNIELYVALSDDEVSRITIYCENEECNHWLDINYNTNDE